MSQLLQTVCQRSSRISYNRGNNSRIDKEYKKEVAALIASGKTEEDAKANAPILLSAKDMLLKWEAGEEHTVALWKEMNGWVYEGFNETYKNIGVDFDKLYYESSTYLLGKEFVDEGLLSGVFFRKDGTACLTLPLVHEVARRGRRGAGQRRGRVLCGQLRRQEVGGV